MKQKKKKPLAQYITVSIFFLICVIGGAFSGYNFGEMLSGEIDMATKFFIVSVALLCIALVLMLNIIVHEVGHLVFGLMSGYKFESFRVGSLMWIKIDGKIKFKRFSLAGTGGQCLMSAPDFIDGKIPYILYNLGGSMANIIVSSISFFLYIQAQNIPYLSQLLMTISVIGLILAVMNAIPMQLGGIDNDGCNTMSIRKNPGEMLAFWKQLKINSLSTSGERLKNMPEELFVLPEISDMNNSMCSSVAVFAFNRAMDEMDFKKGEQIGNYILQHSEELVSIYRNILAAEMIYCELIGENRESKIKEAYTKEFKKFLKLMASTPSIIRMQYAYELLLNKDSAAADSYLAKFESIAEKHPYSAEVEGERELIAHTKKVHESRANLGLV